MSFDMISLRVAVISLPKSGTHLLGKVLSLFPQFMFSGKHLGPKTNGYDIWQRLGVSLGLFNSVREKLGFSQVRIGVDLPHYASKREVYRFLARVPKGSFLTAHLPYSDLAFQIVQQLQYKIIVMVRDPRDVAVSFSYYVVGQRHHPLKSLFSNMTHTERLLVTINGMQMESINFPALVSRFKSIQPWLEHKDSLVMHFEDLVGSRGGGTDREQHLQIERIGEFLGLGHEDFSVEHIANNAFGAPGGNFRKGQVGSWREEFESEHVEAIKATFGRYLLDLGYEKNLDW